MLASTPGEMLPRSSSPKAVNLPAHLDLILDEEPVTPAMDAAAQETLIATGASREAHQTPPAAAVATRIPEPALVASLPSRSKAVAASNQVTVPGDL